jgi:hypothetical protein
MIVSQTESIKEASEIDEEDMVEGLEVEEFARRDLRKEMSEKKEEPPLLAAESSGDLVIEIYEDEVTSLDVLKSEE